MSDLEDYRVSGPIICTIAIDIYEILKRLKVTFHSKYLQNNIINVFLTSAESQSYKNYIDPIREISKYSP